MKEILDAVAVVILSVTAILIIVFIIASAPYIFVPLVLIVCLAWVVYRYLEGTFLK